MKKLLVLFLAAFVTVGVVGTASAIDYVRPLPAGVSYFASPVVSGNTAYVVGMIGGSEFSTVRNGASVFQIDFTRAGASKFFRGAIDPLGGSSIYGTPALYKQAGDSGITLIFQVAIQPGHMVVPGGGIAAGTSLFSVYYSPTNSGATSWSSAPVSLAQEVDFRGSVGTLPPWYGGATQFVPHLTVAADANGTSVYGASGVSCVTGASIWAIGVGGVNGTGRLTNNQWSSANLATAGISSFFTAPLVSGNSLFILGNFASGVVDQGASGVSLLAFNRSKLHEGPTNQVRVLGPTGTIAVTHAGVTPIATPAISGNSLFVVDGRGGLTAYSISPSRILFADRTNGDFVQLSVNGSVTASPVCDTDHLVVAVNHATGAAGITCFQISNKRIAGTSGISWWMEWAGATITASPAMSNGHVYVAVNFATNVAKIFRFSVDTGKSGVQTTVDQEWTVDANSATFGQVEVPSLAISGNRLIFISNALKRLYAIDISSSSRSYDYWYQFKFDERKTGTNSVPISNPVIPDDDGGGCFLTTIK